MSILVPVQYHLDYCSFVIHFETENVSPSVLFFSFKNGLALLGFLHFQKYFRISLLLTSAKKTGGTLIGIVFDLWMHLGSIAILTILNLLVNEYVMSFHLLSSSVSFNDFSLVHKSCTILKNSFLTILFL